MRFGVFPTKVVIGYKRTMVECADGKLIDFFQRLAKKSQILLPVGDCLTVR